MDRKETLFYGIFIVIIVACMVYLLLPPLLKLSYVLDDAHLASIHPVGVFPSFTCPQDGSKLRQISIISRSVLNVAWEKSAFYCEVEDIFWIYEVRGEDPEINFWGPFEGNLRTPNLLASSLMVLTGIALFFFYKREVISQKLSRTS